MLTNKVLKVSVEYNDKIRVHIKTPFSKSKFRVSNLNNEPFIRF